MCSNSFLDLNVFLNNAALENVQRINAVKQWAVAALACLYCEDNKILTTNHFFLQFSLDYFKKNLQVLQEGFALIEYTRLFLMYNDSLNQGIIVAEKTKYHQF